MNGASNLRDRLDAVRDRIARSAARAGRNPKEVTLIGVSKSITPARVREAVDLGLADLGENRVQEAEVKLAAVGRTAARWHMIGHLQRNKAGKAVELFDRVHSLDSVELAASVSRRAAAAGIRLPVLLEVNVSGESSKHGVAPQAAASVAASIAELPALALDGLMTIAPFSDAPEEARPHFAALRRLRDRLERDLRLTLPQLSMGMTADFEVAVEEGSTMVRIGTALFGERLDGAGPGAVVPPHPAG